MVGGPILARRPHTPAARFAERLFDQERAITAARIPYVITANLCVRRSILESAGMFDVAMPRGQDVDLSYRVSARYPELFAFAKHAVVEHRNPDTLGALFRKGLQHGRSVGLLADRHAELLGETALARFLSLPRYTHIAAGLGAFSLSSVERLVGASRRLEHEWRDPLYDAVFNGGKQLGVAAHLMSKAVGREPE
jgi:hypothetical protein